MITEYAEFLLDKGWRFTSWDRYTVMLCQKGARVAREIRINYAAERPSPDEVF